MLGGDAWMLNVASHLLARRHKLNWALSLSHPLESIPSIGLRVKLTPGETVRMRVQMGRLTPSACGLRPAGAPTSVNTLPWM